MENQQKNLTVLEKYEDTKGVIRGRKSRNNWQYNDKKKKKSPNNYLQNTTQKTKDGATPTPLKTGGGELK